MASVRAFLRRLTVILLALALGPAAESARAQSVFVPSFWDPHHRIAKPNIRNLRNLRFLTEDDYPPFHFALPDGTLAGFDIDVARALCAELNAHCTVQARSFDTLVDALESEQGDAIIAPIRIDAQSRAKLDFSAPYYSMPARFVSLTAVSSEDAIPETLRKKTVGVQAGTAHEAYLKTFFPEAILKPYRSQTELRAALLKAEVDTVFGDGISLSLWLVAEGRECCRFRGGPYLDQRFFGEGAAIAVKKGNRELREALDWALASIAARGIYTDLYLKYFPLGFY
jgi:polar amino acid transport system substrate-binding protein